MNMIKKLFAGLLIATLSNYVYSTENHNQSEQYNDGTCFPAFSLSVYSNSMCYGGTIYYQELTEEVKKAKYVFMGKEYNYKNFSRFLDKKNFEKNKQFDIELIHYIRALEYAIKIKEFNYEDVYMAFMNKRKKLYKKLFEEKLYSKLIIQRIEKIDNLFLVVVNDKETKQKLINKNKKRIDFLKLIESSYKF
ncbi:hypothetical protein A4G19_08710 [Pasteurellaceae bacterium Macca]|nr:hypothetical protein [Pasteurellaceae bacterium Macca]